MLIPILMCISVLIWYSQSIVLGSIYSLFIVTLFYFVETRKKIDFFSPFMFVSFLFVIGFFLRPLVLYFFLGDFYRPDWGFNYQEFITYSLRAILVAQIGYLCFLYGYQIVIKSNNSHARPLISRYTNKSELLIYAFWLSVLGFSAYFVYVLLSGYSYIEFLKQNVSIDKSGKYLLFAASWLFVLGNLPLLDYARRVKKKLVYLVYLSHFSMSCLVCVSFHDRKWLVFFLISIAIYFNYFHKKLSKKTVLFMGIILFLLLMGMLILRNALYGYSASADVEVQSVDSAFFIYQLFMGGMFGYFDYFAFVLNAFEKLDIMPMYGVKFFLLSFLPSGLFEFEKPVPISQWIVSTQWGLTYSARAPGITVFGEFFVFGGYAGVMVGMFLLGVFFRNIYETLTRAPMTIARLLLYVLFFQSYFIVIRSMFLPATTHFIMTICMLIVVFFFVKITMLKSNGSLVNR